MRSVVLLLLALLLPSYVLGLGFYLQQNEEMCFRQDVLSGEMILLDYNVDNGVVAVVVKDVFARPIYEKTSVSSGKYTTTARESGEYTVCFSNNVDGSIREKAVTLKFLTGASLVVDNASTAKRTKLKPVEEAVQSLETILASIKIDEREIKEKQDSMRAINDSTSSRVMWFSALSLIILVGTSVAQIVYLKRYFKSKNFFE